MTSRDYSKIGGLPYVLSGWMLRFGFESRLRPHWSLLPNGLQNRILDVYYQRADPDSLTITKADLDELSEPAWQALERELS